MLEKKQELNKNITNGVLTKLCKNNVIKLLRKTLLFLK
jgi:hypothetical protein